MRLKISVSNILAQGHLWYFKNYQKLIEITSNMIDMIALGGGFKCPRKIHLITQWGGGHNCPLVPTALQEE